MQVLEAAPSPPLLFTRIVGRRIPRTMAATARVCGRNCRFCAIIWDSRHGAIARLTALDQPALRCGLCGDLAASDPSRT